MQPSDATLILCRKLFIIWSSVPGFRIRESSRGLRKRNEWFYHVGNALCLLIFYLNFDCVPNNKSTYMKGSITVWYQTMGFPINRITIAFKLPRITFPKPRKLSLGNFPESYLKQSVVPSWKPQNRVDEENQRKVKWASVRPSALIA